jgi:hypothetical protein
MGNHASFSVFCFRVSVFARLHNTRHGYPYNAIEHNPSSEVDACLASQEILYLLWDSEVRYCVQAEFGPKSLFISCSF